MAYTEYVAQVTPAVADNDNTYLKNQGTRDGAMWTADWVLARCQEGRVFIANAGTVTTPITFGATSLSATEYDLFISVPSGTTIGLLQLDIYMEAFGTDGILEVLAVSGTGGTVGAGTSITPRSVRTDLPVTSLCTITAAATTTSGVAITGNEIFRDGSARVKTITTFGSTGGATLKHKFTFNHKDAGWMPIIVGAGQLGVFASSVAGTGFITATYVEIPSTRIT